MMKFTFIRSDKARRPDTNPNKNCWTRDRHVPPPPSFSLSPLFILKAVSLPVRPQLSHSPLSPPSKNCIYRLSLSSILSLSIYTSIYPYFVLYRERLPITFVPAISDALLSSLRDPTVDDDGDNDADWFKLWFSGKDDPEMLVPFRSKNWLRKRKKNP